MSLSASRPKRSLEESLRDRSRRDHSFLRALAAASALRNPLVSETLEELGLSLEISLVVKTPGTPYPALFDLYREECE